MRSNIRQVAARAGVSPSTVSNVLLGRHGNVSPATLEQVLLAVRELEYVPVRPTLQNRVAKTGVLALTLANPSQIHGQFHAQTYAGICETALQHNFDILTVLRPDPNWAVDRSGIGLLDRRSDGIIILSPTDYASSTLEALVRHGIPTVVCYRRDVPEGIAWVDPDNRQGMFEAVSCLRKAGHTEIGHLTRDTLSRFDFLERRRSFAEALADGGREKEECVVELTVDVSGEVAHSFHTRGMTAVVCASDWLAIQLWTKLEEIGLRVPQDISLIGVDNSLLSQQYGLTTMGFSFAEVGSRAVEALLGQIAGHAAIDCCHQISMQLFERSSVKTIS